MVRLALAAVAIALMGCTFPEQPIPPGDPQLVVHAILDPSQRYQNIHLDMTDGFSGDFPALTSVAIVTPDGTTLMAHRDSLPNSQGKATGVLSDYRVDLQAAGVSLIPGGKYQLHIALANGNVVTGETTIPNGSPASLPAPLSFVRARDTLQLSWDRVPGARTYEVQVWSAFELLDGSHYIFGSLRYTAFADTSVTLAGSAHNWEDNEIFGPNTSTRVVVYAVDDNYYEYYRLLGDPFIGAAPTRLSGGLGVFASMIPVAQRQLTVK